MSSEKATEFQDKIQAHHVKKLYSELKFTLYKVQKKEVSSLQAKMLTHLDIHTICPGFFPQLSLFLSDDCFVFLFLTQADLTPRRAAFPTVSHFTKLSPQPAINDNCWISICKILQPWQDHLIDLWSRMRCHVGLPRVGSISWCCKNVKDRRGKDW